MLVGQGAAFIAPVSTLQFIHLREDGTASEGGPAPYLDCRPIEDDERALVSGEIVAPWLSGSVEDRAMAYAIAALVPQHLAEIRRRRSAEIDKVEREVRARLDREIIYWDARAARLREEERAGKEQRINASNAEATAQRLVDRLQLRQSELTQERQISALSPVLRGAALIIPRGLLLARSQPAALQAGAGFSDDPNTRAKSSGWQWNR